MGFSYLNSYRWFVEAKHSLFSLKGQPVDPRLIALQENNFTSLYTSVQEGDLKADILKQV
jgi:hypothetical protein